MLPRYMTMGTLEMELMQGDVQHRFEIYNPRSGRSLIVSRRQRTLLGLKTVQLVLLHDSADEYDRIYSIDGTHDRREAKKEGGVEVRVEYSAGRLQH